MLQYIALLVGLLLYYLTSLIVYVGGNDGKFGGGDYRSTQAKVLAAYRRFRIPPKKVPFNEFCYPKSFTVQKPQAMIGEWMSPGKRHDSLLVFHRAGAGKTCLAIQVAERWKTHGKPLILMPASLIPGFRNELRSLCGGGHYISDEDMVKISQRDISPIEYKQIIRASDEEIDKVYNIMSYNKFATSNRVKASVIIIDEVQNVNGAGTFGTTIKQWIHDHPDVPVVVMSGTPIFDNVTELEGLAEMLRIAANNGKQTPQITPLITSPDDVKRLFDGKVSFYAGAPDYTFPEMHITVKQCVMSAYQAKWYKSEVEAEMKKQQIHLVKIKNDFYVKTRQRSNIVFPNGLTGDEGLRGLSKQLIKNNLAVYSAKFAALLKKLRKKELSFIYSGFTGLGGIAALTKCLRAFGWEDFAVSGPGPRRYAIWSGEESGGEKDRIRQVYNSPANDDCSQIQIIIGSPAIKEGVSLLRTRQVHILEPYWNHSRLLQVYARAVRFCSHKSLPKAERDVQIYIYAAVTEKNPKIISPETSVDLYMLDIADQKREASEPYVEALRECAFDKRLW